MRYEKVNNCDELFTKRTRYSRISKDILELHADKDFRVVRVIGAKEHYASLSSAQASYNGCIRRLGLSMKSYIIDDELYIARLYTGDIYEESNVSYRSED